MNNSFYLCGFMGVGKTTILNNIKTQTVHLYLVCVLMLFKIVVLPTPINPYK